MEDIMNVYLIKENYQSQWKIAYVCENNLQALKRTLKHYLLDEEQINNFRSEADYYKDIYNLIADEKVNNYHLINDLLKANIVPLHIELVGLSNTEEVEYLN